MRNSFLIAGSANALELEASQSLGLPFIYCPTRVSHPEKLISQQSIWLGGRCQEYVLLIKSKQTRYCYGWPARIIQLFMLVTPTGYCSKSNIDSIERSVWGLNTPITDCG